MCLGLAGLSEQAQGSLLGEASFAFQVCRGELATKQDVCVVHCHCAGRGNL